MPDRLVVCNTSPLRGRLKYTETPEVHCAHAYDVHDPSRRETSHGAPERAAIQGRTASALAGELLNPTLEDRPMAPAPEDG